MAQKRKIITGPRGMAKKIAKSQKCGLATVYNALNYTSHSESAERIRKIAISDYGGIETTKIYF